MKNLQNKWVQLLTVCCLIVVMNSCSPSQGDKTGHEFMPGMAHSIAYEANYYDYYYYNTWGTEDEYYKMAQARQPVEGTIARGYVGVQSAPNAAAAHAKMKMLQGQASPNGIAVPLSGAVPYYYQDTEEERTRAMAEIINNPFPITDAGLARGKELYDINCAICHGTKADGNGYLVAEENPNVKFPAQPANFLTDEFIAASNGRYYHSIIYGKNMMGSHVDKLSYEERWQVIHYIRSLQAKEKKLVYNEQVNSLNTVDIPGSQVEAIASSDLDADGGGHDHDTDDHGNEGGGQDHDGGDHDH